MWWGTWGVRRARSEGRSSFFGIGVLKALGAYGCIGVFLAGPEGI